MKTNPQCINIYRIQYISSWEKCMALEIYIEEEWSQTKISRGTETRRNYKKQNKSKQAEEKENRNQWRENLHWLEDKNKRQIKSQIGSLKRLAKLRNV